MIIFIIGNIGSGKTICGVREIVTSGNFPIVNFKLKGLKYHRLRFSDIITTVEDEKGKKTMSVNWDFWNDFKTKHKNFSIFLDEAHSIISSRNSHSKQNQLLSNWIAQIRKILSDSMTNHIYIISQRIRRIDINFRELCHIVITCEKVEHKDKIYILLKYYDGVEGYENNSIKGKVLFSANQYFKYYNTLEMVQFSDGGEYV